MVACKPVHHYSTRGRGSDDIGLGKRRNRALGRRAGPQREEVLPLLAVLCNAAPQQVVCATTPFTCEKKRAHIIRSLLYVLEPDILVEPRPWSQAGGRIATPSGVSRSSFYYSIIVEYDKRSIAL